MLLFELLSMALGSKKSLSRTYSDKEWWACYEMAEKQGVVGVCFGAIDAVLSTSLLKGENTIPFELKMQWIGVAELCRQMYNLHKSVIVQLADFYSKHSVGVLLLKGYGLSLDYPVPELRPVGDIDIYLGSSNYSLKREGLAFDIGDELICDELGILVESGFHKHSNFIFKGVSVENHHKFLDDELHESNRRFEKILESCLSASKILVCPITNCFLPTPTWNALFLLRHAGEHFAVNEISLRHILDLGTFFKVHNSEIEWEFVLNVYENEGMLPFYDAIATICVCYLGINACSFRGYRHNVKLADKVLDDIFLKKKELPMSSEGIRGFIKAKYCAQKALRWWRNRWKFHMVYRENLWKCFWTLAVNRIRS